MKQIYFSDTHRAHRALTLPKADFHIFTGDCTGRGSKSDVLDFLAWFSKQDSTYKIMIAGNHDFFFETHPNEVKEMMPDNIIYLNDSGVEIEGIKFWGSPISPFFYNWAFNRFRCTDEDWITHEDIANGIKKHWDLIPNDTDILLTHGPSYGVLDLLDPKFRRRGEDPHVGCRDLKIALDRVKPKILAFGHIHETYGTETDSNGVYHINSSLMDKDYNFVNDPIEVWWDNNKNKKKNSG